MRQDADATYLTDGAYFTGCRHLIPNMRDPATGQYRDLAHGTRGLHSLHALPGAPGTPAPRAAAPACPEAATARIEAATVKRELQAALRTWELRTPPSPNGNEGGPNRNTVGLDVKRLARGKRGWVVRIVCGERGQGGPVVAEWRRPTDEAAQTCYLLVMQALASLRGFGGIVASSSDTDAPLGPGDIDWEQLL